MLLFWLGFFNFSLFMKYSGLFVFILHFSYFTFNFISHHKLYYSFCSIDVALDVN